MIVPTPASLAVGDPRNPPVGAVVPLVVPGSVSVLRVISASAVSVSELASTLNVFVPDSSVGLKHTSPLPVVVSTCWLFW